MPEPLWTWEALIAAAGGAADGAPPAHITGVSIDTRTLEPGDLFVALKDRRDGHEFVTSAFKAGAAAALVAERYPRHPDDGALLRVGDPLEALTGIGRTARARLSPDARIVAVTGSAGKTGTKEMLRACLARLGPTHASEKSYNNHWGVPLTLARMPAGTAFGVFEIGMNHAGEITPLTRLVRPHVAIITTVGPVHLEFFPSVEAIADAKAEIFSGLEPGGTAVVNRDNPHFERLSARARGKGAAVISFGRNPAADLRCTKIELHPASCDVTVEIAGRPLRYSVGLPGEHIAANSLAVVAALHALGVDVGAAVAALARLDAPSGRGRRVTLPAPGGAILLIDESYNANPASMRAALATLALVPRDEYPRRVAVLGDMLELGAGARDLHLGLKQAVDAAGVDLVFAVGPNMQALFEAIEPARRGCWAESSGDLAAPLLDALRAGDAVMVKGSFGTRMAPLVEAVALKYAGRPPAREEN